MITPSYCQLMARYNAWQNTATITVASSLTDEDRRRDRGAFFGSIHATLNHLLWGDKIWMHRFAGTPQPAQKSIADSLREPEKWDAYRAERKETDAAILSWAEGIGDQDLSGDLTWHSGAVGREVSRPLPVLIVGFFNHQTHHRGQIHGMLTAAGATTEDTDLFVMPEA